MRTRERPQPPFSELSAAASLPWRRYSAEAALAHRALLAHTKGPLRWLPLDHPELPSAWLVRMTIHGAMVAAHVQAQVLSTWARPAAGARVPHALANAGVAHAGAPLWQALSTMLNAPVQFIEARSLHALRAPDDAIGWMLPALGWRGHLFAPSAAAWARIVSTVSPRISAEGGGLDAAQLPLDMVFGLGHARLRQAEFARLRRHCVVLLDNVPPLGPRQRSFQELPVSVLVGATRRVCARAMHVLDHLIRLPDSLTAIAPAFSSPPIGSDMTDPTRDATPPKGTAAAHSPIDLTDVELEVRFELGRQRWPLRSLVQWRVGQPLPLEAPMRDTTVTAWLNERCIANGKLVVVGDRLGVRLDELLGSPALASAVSPAKAEAAIAGPPLAAAPGPRSRAKEGRAAPSAPRPAGKTARALSAKAAPAPAPASVPDDGDSSDGKGQA
jgi:flagellar motor switch/type III secretory pathway protein FliN